MATSKVLIVDQEPQRLRETGRLLQSAKYQVLGASSGEECLRTAREKRPEMILLDAALPDVSGIDLANQIKRDPELADVYVAVVLPEDTASPIRARALENGADAYLLRELPKREFAARLEALLRRASSEQAMRTSLAKWRQLLNAIDDAVYIVNTEHRIVDCNVALAKMFGKAPSEVIGSPCYTLIHGTSKPIPNCLHKRIGETKRRETLLVSMDDRWLQVAVDPLLDENNELIGSVHILSDITERKLQEDALHQARSDLLKRLEEQRAAQAKTEEALQAEVAAREEVEQALQQARAKMEKQAENNLAAMARVDGVLKEEQSRSQALQGELERTQQQVLEYEASLKRTQEQLGVESTERQRAEQDRKQLQEALLSQAAEREQTERVLTDLRSKLKGETAQREQLQQALDAVTGSSSPSAIMRRWPRRLRPCKPRSPGGSRPRKN
jgi:PAS domain S-box-containing protein